MFPISNQALSDVRLKARQYEDLENGKQATRQKSSFELAISGISPSGSLVRRESIGKLFGLTGKAMAY